MLPDDLSQYKGKLKEANTYHVSFSLCHTSQTFSVSHLIPTMWGCLSGSVDYASALGSGRCPRVQGLSPVWGIPAQWGDCFSPSTNRLFSLSLSLCYLCLSNK